MTLIAWEAALKKERLKLLQNALDLLIVHTDDIDLTEIMACVQHSTLNRRDMHEEIGPIYPNLDLFSGVIDALHPITSMDYETADLIDLAERLEQLKINICNIKVMA